MPKFKIDKKTAQELREIGICGYKDGLEIHDPVPLTVTGRRGSSETMEQKLSRIVNIALARQAAEQDMETIEEMLDFSSEELEIDELPTVYQIHGMEIKVQNATEEKPNAPEPTIPPTPGGEPGGEPNKTVQAPPQGETGAETT